MASPWRWKCGTLSARMILRVLSQVLVAAGIFTHVVYLLVQPPPLASSSGSLLFLALILAIFSLYGSLHHPRLAWGLFVLPLVVGLVILATLSPPPQQESGTAWAWLQGRTFWGAVHGILVLLAAVGVCIGFLASLMYFVQLYRLRSKMAPGAGMKLMSLERLETMNRRAILWAFPLLTAGLLVGVAMQIQSGDFLQGWSSPKIASALGLWFVFAVLLYLRYGVNARGRQVALLTMVAFVVLMMVLLAPVHPFLGQEATP